MESGFKAGVLTVSDKGAKGLRKDESGEVVSAMLTEQGFGVVHKEIVPDVINEIAGTLIKWVDQSRLSLIVTSGGTGLSPRDVTPQAMEEVIDYAVPGIAEAMRSASLKKTPHAMISRAMAGVRKTCLIINVPGSPRAARENLSVVLPALKHALSKLAGDMGDCAAIEHIKSADAAELTKTYFEKMKANFQSADNLKITPDNVFQEGIRNNYDLFMELVDQLMLPGSCVRGATNLQKIAALLQDKKSILFLMKHAGNFDVPCFYSLLSKEGEAYQEILNRLVFIAGRKLNENSVIVKTFTEIFSRLVIVPNREIPPKVPNESSEQRAYREAVVADAGRINRAALRAMMKLRNEGRIIVLFPMGGRPKPGLTFKGVKETTSYMRLFDMAYFIKMEGNLLPVGQDMKDEIPQQDKIVFTVSQPVKTKTYLEESRQLFERQKAEGDIDQFNVDRIMLEIGQTESR